MKKEIKKFSQGKISLGVSFWVWYVIGGGVLSLPFWIIPDAASNQVGWAAFLTAYFIFMLVAIIFLMMGVWRSAEEYKKIKRKKKQGAGWGTAAQVYIILSAIRGFVEIIKIFQS